MGQLCRESSLAGGLRQWRPYGRFPVPMIGADAGELLVQGFLYRSRCAADDPDKGLLRNGEGSSLSVVWGMKYIRPGRTSRTELTWAETCLMLSKMVPSSFAEDDVAVLAHQLHDETLLSQIPSSSRCSISNSMIRSRPGWDTLTMRPVPMCFLSNMQKFGAVKGLVCCSR